MTQGATSNLTAGKDIHITATGAGKDSDLTVQGANLTAGHNLSLKADDEIKLFAAQNTAEQHSTNKNSSASVGVSYGTDGLLFNVSASGGKGKADGNDVTWTNTYLDAGQTLSLDSGGDTTLKGAVARGDQLIAKIGGDLTLESLQDTATYDSKQKSAGFGLSVGYGKMSGSVNASQSTINSDFASVTEQSGLKAGDRGFQAEVKGKTELKGAVIASTQTAVDDDKNSFKTASLTTSDIQNKANASAKSSGFSLSSDMLTQGKYGLAQGAIGNFLNNGSNSGSSSGVSRSAVSGGKAVIADEAKQKALTGKTGSETIARLNRDTANAQTAAGRLDYQAMEKTAKAEQAIKQETFKIVSTFTDEAYRSRFETQPKLIKVECPVGADCVADPKLLMHTSATPEELAKATANSILAVNGIFNDENRAVDLAYQNTEPVLYPQTGEKDKPTTVYLMYIAPAKNTVSELLGVAYEKVVNSADYGLANFLGYTNGAMLYADLLTSRGDQATLSLGHSRGTLIQESAFTIAHNRLDEHGNAYTNSNLSVRGVGGAANVDSYTAKAAVIINDPERSKSISFNYFSNDPVAVWAGGNPGVATIKDLWTVVDTQTSMHSGYGAGCKECSKVEIPLINQGTPDGNGKLIRFVGGVQVDVNNNPIQQDK